MTKYLEHDGQEIRINGFAAVWNTEIRVRGRTEEFARGAFLPVLNFGASVRATIDHERSQTFACVRDGSLRLWEDATGLAFSALVPASPHGRGWAHAVADGCLGASVLFRPFKTEKTSTGCIVQHATLTDICVTGAPAYPTAAWLAPFELMNHMDDSALLLRRRWIGGALKAKREAREAREVREALAIPPSEFYYKALAAARAHHEARPRWARRPA